MSPREFLLTLTKLFPSMLKRVPRMENTLHGHRQEGKLNKVEISR